jgi:hypothetical protein
VLTEHQLHLRHGESDPTIRPRKRCSSALSRDRQPGNRDNQARHGATPHGKPQAMRSSHCNTSFDLDLAETIVNGTIGLRISK